MERKGGHHFFGSNGDDDCVSSIVSTRTPRTDVDLGRQDVDELALPLVSPLRSQDHSNYKRQMSIFLCFSRDRTRTTHRSRITKQLQKTEQQGQIRGPADPEARLATSDGRLPLSAPQSLTAQPDSQKEPSALWRTLCIADSGCFVWAHYVYPNTI